MVTKASDAPKFAITWDYRCPYARIAHDHVVTALRGGASWDVTFLPYCLGQSHVDPGEIDIWDRPQDDTGLFALQFAVAVRDHQSDHFLDLHSALYNYRHEQNGNLSDIDSVGRIAQSVGINVETVMADIASGRTLETVKDEHTRYAESHAVWGVPTFIVGPAAVFVRLLDRPKSAEDATNTVERILANIGWDNLNEFKHTSVPR
jgi:hypothetical protein